MINPKLSIADDVFKAHVAGCREYFGLRLQATGCDIWLDLDRLKSGMNSNIRIEEYIRSKCSLFVSVISSRTERQAESYAQRESIWASNRAAGIADMERDKFYHPVVVEDNIDPGEIRYEPRMFTVSFEKSDFESVRSIQIEDNGGGLPFHFATDAFEKIGNSAKQLRRANGEHLHGRKGELHFHFTITLERIPTSVFGSGVFIKVDSMTFPAELNGLRLIRVPLFWRLASKPRKQFTWFC